MRTAVILMCISACGGAAPASHDVRVDREHALVHGALAAKGRKLTDLKGIRWIAAGTAGADPITNTRVLLLPDRMRSDTVIGTTKNTSIIDGDHAWKRIQREGQPLELAAVTGAQLEGYRQDVWLDPDFMLRHATASDAKLSAAPDAGGRPCVGLAAPGIGTVTLCFDPASKQLVQLSYTQRGEALAIEMSDFRDVSGIQFGFRRKITYPDLVVDVTYSSIELDPNVSAGYFDRPAD